MENSVGNYKRIAKNTLMLYIRMIFVMFTALFTMRVILAALGQQDYGLYNVIGGIIVMFSFLTHTLSSASQRFYSYNIGKNDNDSLCQIYSNTIILYAIVVVGILILAETVGLWFLNTKMTIPAERMLAANIIYQFTIFSFCWKVYTAAHQALIIAYEQMSVYAYVSVAEVVLQLMAAYLLTIYGHDRLVMYGFLMFITHFLTNGFYILYSRRKFKNIRFSLKWNWPVMKEILAYSGWTIFGMLALVVRSSGINIVLNVFFNPIINTARGIAFTINSVVSSVVSNFYTAVRPQIVKNYSKQDLEACYKLVFRSTRFSYCLALLLVLPLFMFATSILDFWLSDYPHQTVAFVRLTLITALIDSMASPMISFNQATGKIKVFQLIISILLILNLPLAIIAFELGAGPTAAFVISLIISIIAYIARLLIISREHSFPALRYMKEAIIPLAFVTLASIIMIPAIHSYTDAPQSLFQLFFLVAVTCVWVSICSFFLGFNKVEREFALKTIKKKIQR